MTVRVSGPYIPVMDVRHDFVRGQMGYEVPCDLEELSEMRETVARFNELVLAGKVEQNALANVRLGEHGWIPTRSWVYRLKEGA